MPRPLSVLREAFPMPKPRAPTAPSILVALSGTLPKQSRVVRARKRQVRKPHSFAIRHVVRRSRIVPGIPYSNLSVGVPLEIFPNERRVALTPQNATLLLKKGFGQVLVEKSAGLEAQFLDEQYKAAGATLVDKSELFTRSDILLKVRAPAPGHEAELVKKGSTLISFLYPGQNKATVEALAARKSTVFAMEMIPRISRAQVFDALRSVIVDRAVLTS